LSAVTFRKVVIGRCRAGSPWFPLYCADVPASGCGPGGAIDG